MYIFHPGFDRTDVMIHQHFYRPGIIESFQRVVTVRDTFQRKKRSTTTKNGKLPAKLVEKSPCNKLCVDLIGS